MKSRRSAFHALIFFVFAAAVVQTGVGTANAAKRPPLPSAPPDSTNWIFQARGAMSSPCLSTDGLTLYVGSGDRHLYAIPTDQVSDDPSTTEIKWKLKLPGPIFSAPIINEDGLIYVGCSDGRLYGISDQGDSGRIDLRSLPLGRPLSTPALGEDGTIYAGTTGNRLYALFPDLARKWSYVAPDDVRTPVITDDGTILIVAGGFLRGVSEDGAEASSFTPRSAIHSLPALAEDGTIYFGANNERVYALNSGATTNDIRWRFNTGKNVASSPAIGADGRIYIASENSRLYCFTTNGAVRWSVATRGVIHSALSIGVDGTIYAGCDDTRFYAISSDGEILWTVKTRAPVRTSAALDAFGAVYFSSGKTVYAIQTEAMADDSDELPWQMFRKDPRHTARAIECRPFLIEEPHVFDGTNNVQALQAIHGEAVSISVVVRAGASLTFQWRLNGAEIDPDENRTATNATFLIPSVSAADAGEYTVHAFNDCGEVESEIFTLSVTNSPPMITSGLTNQLLLAGNTLTLAITAVGSPPLTYQWKFGPSGTVIAGATNATFITTNVQASDSGVYTVMVMNGATNISASATVTVFQYTLDLADHPLGAGQRHSLAVLPDRTLWAWGLNNFGQLGDGNSGSNGTNFVLLNKPQLIGTNGTVTTNAVWAGVSGGSRGYDAATNQPGGFSIGIQTNGTLWAWGLNDRGQLGIDSFALQRVPVRVGTDTNWVQAEAGATHVIALKRDGTLWTWGANEAGQLGIASTANNSPAPVRVGTDSAWVEVRAGGVFSLARRADGTIWAWGTNGHGQLGLGTNATRLRSPVMIGTNADWAGISAGVFHSLGLKSNGTLWAWGRNNFGQLGLGIGSGNGNEGSLTNNRPAQVGANSDWAMIDAGSFHSFAINTSGKLFGWGANFFGQLGDGSSGSSTSTNDANKVSPVAITPDQTWRIVDASSHSLGLTADGNVWGWGWNNNGQVGDGAGGDGTRNNNRSLPVLLSFSPNTNAIPTNAFPAIAQQPANLNATEGTPASFSVIATGAPPFSYQWYFHSNAIAASANATATSATLSITNSSSANAGFYHVTVANTFGSVTSIVVSLSVNATSGPPVITQQPPLLNTVFAGSNVLFTVGVAGAAPLFFQWRYKINAKDTASNSTATSATLMLASVTTNDAGFYDVVVTNTLGAVTSAVVRLLVVSLPGAAGIDVLAESDVRIESITVTTNGVAIQATGVAGRKALVLEYKDVLNDLDWKPLSTNDISELKLFDLAPPLNRSRYYRVRAE